MVDLTQMKPGEKGIIKELRGGREFVKKLSNIGLREGKEIKKLSSHFWGGPQTVEVERACVSIGFGMAKKIMIKIKKMD